MTWTVIPQEAGGRDGYLAAFKLVAEVGANMSAAGLSALPLADAGVRLGQFLGVDIDRIALTGCGRGGNVYVDFAAAQPDTTRADHFVFCFAQRLNMAPSCELDAIERFIWFVRLGHPSFTSCAQRLAMALEQVAVLQS